MELPLCLLGPGGDYVYPWPDESAPENSTSENIRFAREPLDGSDDRSDPASPIADSDHPVRRSRRGR